jgi:hypothetical protein
MQIPLLVVAICSGLFGQQQQGGPATPSQVALLPAGETPGAGLEKIARRTVEGLLLTKDPTLSQEES